MAWYKYPDHLRQNPSDAFDTVHTPGTLTQYSGIYRCLGCGHEVVSEHHKQFPTQNHPQHAPEQGAIRWRMVVYAEHKQV